MNKNQTPQTSPAQGSAPMDVDVNIYRPSAQGPVLADASVTIGGCFAIRGIKIKEDKNGPFVFIWFSQAAEQGNQYAQYRLGKLLLNGDGVAKDVADAVHWLTEAADQGNQYAQYALGKLYLLGKDVPQDRDSTVCWFTQAAEQGNQYAQFFLDHMDDIPSLFASATRLLHHMGRIFQDQAPPQTGGVSLVDSKLRKKIREKKIAMGHKPDDHEGQQRMS